MQQATPAWLTERLLAWYDHHRRSLPWRTAPGQPVSPYRVLLSELMLQQTTVATVRPRFASFLARFPSLEALAAADQTEVLHAWQGRSFALYEYYGGSSKNGLPLLLAGAFLRRRVLEGSGALALLFA